MDWAGWGMLAMDLKRSLAIWLALIGTPLFAAPTLAPVKVVGVSAEDVTFSEYSSKDLSMIAQVHTVRLFKDFEHRGFFRIGLLPVPVAENVEIKIRSADYMTNALSGIHFWDEPSLAVRRIEFRNLEIKSFDENQPHLSARLGRFGQDGTLELSNVSITSGTGGQTSIPKAILQISNPSAGWVSWNSGGRQQRFLLFKPISDN